MTEKKNVITAFGMSDIKDYDKLIKEFGVSPMTSLVRYMPDPIAVYRRGIVFAHRDFDMIIDAMEKQIPFVVMTGIKPSNFFHFGSKIVVDQLAYLQKHGGKVVFAVADVESLADNEMPLKEADAIARDNIMDCIALGLDPKKTEFYRQSEDLTVLRAAQVFASNVTNNMLKAIYGLHELKIYNAALVQMGDILKPQLENGKVRTVVPVGFDQDPHIRLVRDIAKKHKLVPPAGTYNKFMGSLTGSAKMSKREPEGLIFLNESAELACRKIKKKAFTGGRNTPEEQRQLGGQPDICKVYELYKFGLIEDDKELTELYKRCAGGKLMCGDCKNLACKKMTAFLNQHHKKRKQAALSVNRILKTKA
ncbi:tryptophan--tRNA ligase [Candidatus Woesearchaeota archaeon]|nr:tryptophan--tRNA ligase [Candidatus Woesearchaeota archaeon]MBT4248021.1 tryptophan--tRNA ligase [Candidatus Woesearchaeota archaeon]